MVDEAKNDVHDCPALSVCVECFSRTHLWLMSEQAASTDTSLEIKSGLI